MWNCRFPSDAQSIRRTDRLKADREDADMNLQAAGPKSKIRLGFLYKFDSHVLFTLLQRGWTIIAGGVTLLMIPSHLSPVEQGYYYAFAGLIAMQSFFDLGFNSIIIQLVGHEFSHLSRDTEGRLQGGAAHRSRLASLLQILRRWYRIAGVLFFVCLFPVGYIFFQTKGDLSPTIWLGPWTLQLLFTALNLYFSSFLAVSEGQGQIGEVAKLRLWQSMFGYALFWLLLLVGAGLWVTPILPAIGAVLTPLWLRGRHDELCIEVDDAGQPMRINWYQEIFPFQWRIALSWISGYFIFSFFTPMIFLHQGAVEAGRVGITLSIFNSVTILGLSWVSAKVPEFAMLIARGQREELNSLFISVLCKSVFATAVICVAFVFSVVGLHALGFVQVNRVASLPVLICMTLVTLANTVIFSAAAYMRAHKEEPMLWNSVTMGVGVLTVVWIFSQVSVLATMATYTALVLGLSLPWTLLIFFRQYYNRKA